MTIIMEDLAAAGYVMVRYFCGKQPIDNRSKDLTVELKGCKTSLPVILEQACLLAARIHLQHWNDPSLVRESWLMSADFYNGQEKVRWEFVHVCIFFISQEWII
jgi:hypothetical protein